MWRARADPRVALGAELCEECVVGRTQVCGVLRRAAARKSLVVVRAPSNEIRRELNGGHTCHTSLHRTNSSNSATHHALSRIIFKAAREKKDACVLFLHILLFILTKKVAATPRECSRGGRAGPANAFAEGLPQLFFGPRQEKYKQIHIFCNFFMAWSKKNAGADVMWDRRRFICC